MVVVTDPGMVLLVVGFRTIGSGANTIAVPFSVRGREARFHDCRVRSAQKTKKCHNRSGLRKLLLKRPHDPKEAFMFQLNYSAALTRLAMRKDIRQCRFTAFRRRKQSDQLLSRLILQGRPALDRARRLPLPTTPHERKRNERVRRILNKKWRHIV